MKGDKAPGPDGFNACFFQKMWHVVGEDVIAAVRSFFESGSLLKEMNHISITLVPKVPNPSTWKDFQPISCCNLVYKCISGILARRLQCVLPELIDKAQVAFIPGRSISDNILVAQEFLCDYHRENTTPRSTIKVDILKVFDIVRWDFLLNLLITMGFPSRFIAWIMECITTPQFSVNINGELAGFFGSSRSIDKVILYPLTCLS